jgi:acylglycerol lipase
VVEEESVVRKRTPSLFEKKRPASALLKALSTLVFLTGCAPHYARAESEPYTPGIENTGKTDPLEAEVFFTRDGLRLGLRHWEAVNPRAIIIALHGMNDYSRAFAMPAPRWAERGITVYALDQRGFGRSPDAGRWAGADLMRQDLYDIVDVLRVRSPELPIFVLGESMGGAVVMSALQEGPRPNADGYILVAPAVWGWSALPLTHRAALWLAANIFPSWTVTGGGLEITPSDNIEMLRENGRDPLFVKATRTDSVYGLVDLMDEAYRAGGALTDASILFVYGGRDEIIPNEATEAVLQSVPDSVDVMRYPEGYHMILRDLAAASRWDDVATWLTNETQQRVAGASFGALAAP